MNRQLFERLLTEAARARVPQLIRRDTLERLDWKEPPLPQASFGYVNDWMQVDGALHDAYLIVPFDRSRLGWINSRTLRLFRFDARRRRFEPLTESRVDAKAGIVYAPISQRGDYGIAGLHGHPLVKETISLLCEWRSRIGTLPESGHKAFGDRICEMVLCAADMKGFLESRTELEKLVGKLGKDSPDGMPPLLSRPAFPGETICDRCHGAGGFLPEMPECHILKEPPDRPCHAAQWENVGPRHISGVIRQLVIDPNVPRRLYAVSANGGIWRLNDRDEYPDTQWRPITEQHTNLRFRALAVAPSDSRVLYAANSTKTRPFGVHTVISEIFVSNHTGNDWTKIHQAGMGVVHKLVVHPENADVVFAATTTGLWLQSVAVGAWTNLFPGRCLDVALDPEDSSIVYLGVQGAGLFKSFTSGATWPVAPILPLDAVVVSDDPTTVTVETGRRTIKIALGRRNKDRTNQSPATRTVVARFGNQINVHHGGGDDPAAWRRVVPSELAPNPNPTPDRPTNIDKVADALFGGNSRRSDSFPARGSDWVNCLAVDPFDPDHLFVGSVGMLESTDGGHTWTIRGGFPHEDHHSVVFDENEQGNVFASNDGGLFLSADGGATWPSMGLAATQPSAVNGTNFAMGLITSEFKSAALRRGRCLAAIDHTGFILCEDFDSRWQFLFGGADSSGKHGHEGSYVFACPASLDRYYVFNNRVGSTGDDPTNVHGRLAQFDFTRTNGLVNPPPFHFLTTGLAPDLPAFFPAQGDFFPDDVVYDTTITGPFAIRFSEDDAERLILYGTVEQPHVGFTIQSLRLATNGTAVTANRTEATNASAFVAIVFISSGGNRAFAMTQAGDLLERDFSDATGRFTVVSRFAVPPGDLFPTKLVPVRAPHVRLYALSQTAIARYDDDGRPMTTIFTLPNPEDERLMSIVAHPSRDGTLFLGTTRGMYISENEGADWEPYRLGMPQVPITQLLFDQGLLYAATYGRGLWRCTPCP
jgi:hypothetical protein